MEKPKLLLIHKPGQKLTIIMLEYKKKTNCSEIIYTHKEFDNRSTACMCFDEVGTKWRSVEQAVLGPIRNECFHYPVILISWLPCKIL